MILARVVGTVVATEKHPAYLGRKVLLLEPIDERGQRAGEEFIAVDHAQAGEGDCVLVLKEGSGTRQLLSQVGQKVPILELVVGIVDGIETAREEPR